MIIGHWCEADRLLGPRLLFSWLPELWAGCHSVSPAARSHFYPILAAFQLVRVAIMCIRGWGAELDQKTVSCCVCVRACTELTRSTYTIRHFPFSSFGPQGCPFSLSPVPQSAIQLQLALSVAQSCHNAVWLLRSLLLCVL